MKRIGLLGCGAIGTQIAIAIDTGIIPARLTHIFDINRNLYKKKLRVYFTKFIRRDKKFKNSAKLIEQMNKDVIFAKKGLKTRLVL